MSITLKLFSGICTAKVLQANIHCYRSFYSLFIIDSTTIKTFRLGSCNGLKRTSSQVASPYKLKGKCRRQPFVKLKMFTNCAVSEGEKQAVKSINILETYIQLAANFHRYNVLKSFSKKW